MRFTVPSFLSLGLAACLSACGGSSGGGGGASVQPPPPLQEVVLEPIQSRTGYIVDLAGGGTAVVAGANNNPVWIQVGDSATQDIVTGYAAFDMSALPADAQIVSAKLHVWQISVDTGFYAKLGPLVVWEIEGSGVLDLGEHNAVARFGYELVTREDLGEYTGDVGLWVENQLGKTNPSLTLRLDLPAAPLVRDADDDFTYLDTDPIALFVVVQYR